MALNQWSECLIAKATYTPESYYDKTSPTDNPSIIEGRYSVKKYNKYS